MCRCLRRWPDKERDCTGEQRSCALTLSNWAIALKPSAITVAHRPGTPSIEPQATNSGFGAPATLKSAQRRIGPRRRRAGPGQVLARQREYMTGSLRVV